ncbi:hypothetical protein CAI21_03995 [Alkalilimnicola ehrlichii]|uniref:CoA-binding domain-containing protein n=1 Tax=Alkalilimnicola ehrlichii TaxID=351052 RepID=A0A3E0X0S1_9GAMM|nr:CoA-binding protein [Alkalilimnicola ehrlichii]RFA30686.1 hypothetical protein CAI21_03995 [Alkalilimnicola ehrlichii]RFA38265.1 hypothetical protein CAL65_05365 [Alkalilimnicola ehrlichii]
MEQGDFENPSLSEIDAFFRGVERIAVVGLSPKAKRPSHGVARVLLSFGFEIVPVRPAVDRVLDRQAYPSLLDVPDRIDVVDVFRAAEFVPEIVDHSLAVGARGLWLQDGIVDRRSAERARDAGLFVVMDDCLARVGHRLGWGKRAD